jgi:hypothetical protein
MSHDANNLDRAIRALRESVTPESLSGAARSAILRRVAEPGQLRSPLAALFPSSWRLAIAGALPLALALTVVGLSGRGREVVAPVESDPVAYKVAGRVVFDVASGATVTKSSVPFRFDERAAVRVEDGRYADSMRDGHRLVFYRIE